MVVRNMDQEAVKWAAVATSAGSMVVVWRNWAVEDD